MLIAGSEGLYQRMLLLQGQLPGQFGGDGPIPSGAIPRMLAQEIVFYHKKQDLAHFAHD